VYKGEYVKWCKAVGLTSCFVDEGKGSGVACASG
jgi:hypothetical protein